jgi:hypothetical protein
MLFRLTGFVAALSVALLAAAAASAASDARPNLFDSRINPDTIRFSWRVGLAFSAARAVNLPDRPVARNFIGRLP